MSKQKFIELKRKADIEFAEEEKAKKERLANWGEAVRAATDYICEYLRAVDIPYSREIMTKEDKRLPEGKQEYHIVKFNMLGSNFNLTPNTLDLENCCPFMIINRTRKRGSFMSENQKISHLDIHGMTEESFFASLTDAADLDRKPPVWKSKSVIAYLAMYDAMAIARVASENGVSEQTELWVSSYLETLMSKMSKEEAKHVMEEIELKKAMAKSE